MWRFPIYWKIGFFFYYSNYEKIDFIILNLFYSQFKSKLTQYEIFGSSFISTIICRFEEIFSVLVKETGLLFHNSKLYCRSLSSQFFDIQCSALLQFHHNKYMHLFCHESFKEYFYDKKVYSNQLRKMLFSVVLKIH